MAPLRLALVAAVLSAGCASSTEHPHAHVAAISPVAGAALWSKAQSVFDARCIVCHGCYDAPCQLKLDSFDGIERGANPTRIYTARPLAIEPTRIFIDARDTATWRKKGFHSVVPEAGDVDVDHSVLLRMLDLKRAHPLTAAVDVPASFTFELNRKEICTKDSGFDDFAKDHPLWGMPYALPGLSDEENAAIVRWVEAGMPHPEPAPLSPEIAASVESWETFLNDGSLRGRLVARYLFEHLWFASLYFEGQGETFFTLVRSRTPPGRPVDEIATRRPFDDPKVDRVWYRLVHRERRPLDKTHIPYPLSPARMAWLQKLFFGSDVVVSSLPGYEPSIAANPFKSFAALPVDARYRFLLEDAQTVMMSFIKGSACRGNIALNVINDRFWVTFVDPSSPWMKDEAALLAENTDLLDLPAEGGSNAPLIQWMQYGNHERRYMEKKSAWLKNLVATRGLQLTPGLLWDGDGKNQNAALTVFRHYDHATVVQGLVGDQPDTAYVVDYALLERITYLIVAGFDLYGGISHQLQTRMYMDYLRMEGEYNFLLLVPSSRRAQLVDQWYRGLSAQRKSSIDAFFALSPGEPPATTSSMPERAAFTAIAARLDAVRSRRFDKSAVKDDAIADALAQLGAVKGKAASFMPELSFVTVTGGDAGDAMLTIVRDSAHTNVAEMFDEDKRRVIDEDDLTAVPGLLGAYPEAFFLVPRAALASFAAAVTALDGPASYATLRKRFGVMRSDPGFWAHSDRVQRAARDLDPIGSGTFDYGRLDPL